MECTAMEASAHLVLQDTLKSVSFFSDGNGIPWAGAGVCPYSVHTEVSY